MRVFVLFSLLMFSINCISGEGNNRKKLKSFLDSKKIQISKKLKIKYQYTYDNFTFSAKNCLAQKSHIGAVGVCLIELKAIEEPVSATYAITVSSNFEGTGDTVREINIVLIDYKL